MVADLGFTAKVAGSGFRVLGLEFGGSEIMLIYIFFV